MDEELRLLVEGAYGAPFLRALTSRLGAIYEETWKELLLEYDHPELHDLLPHVRRAKFERDMRLLATRFGFTGFAERNARKTSFHSQVKAGNVILTASAVASPKTVVRRAEFRQTLARDSQLTLWSDSDDKAGAAYYSLYIHGPIVTPQGLSLPKLGFAHLVFPDRFLTKYIGGVDLLANYAAERDPSNLAVEEIQRATITLLEQLRQEQA
jgi:hypothetical protein